MIQDESRHRLLLSWVLDQVPLLEIELIQSKATDFSSSGIKGTKRKLDVSNDSLKKQNLKRQKPNHRKIGLLIDNGIATEVKDEGEH